MHRSVEYVFRTHRCTLGIRGIIAGVANEGRSKVWMDFQKENESRRAAINPKLVTLTLTKLWFPFFFSSQRPSVSSPILLFLREGTYLLPREPSISFYAGKHWDIWQIAHLREEEKSQMMCRQSTSIQPCLPMTLVSE